ncbi:MAG: hypothetical protein CL917_19080 [Deltaproteobacteria bacterium]|nr:hypothetical protein [Deltaproteobacteria bacterium]
MTRALRERGFVPRRSLWELDHILPLVDGGGHELENLQTLCTPCHKKKTAEEARRRAQRRAAERAPATERKTSHSEVSEPASAPSLEKKLDDALDRAERAQQRVKQLLSELETPKGP